MTFCSVRVDSWDEAKALFGRLPGNWIFRGHEDATWKLASSLERFAGSKPRRDVERRLMHFFRQRVGAYVDRVPDNALELAALMQHHGAPTRLVDFTRSPYVASYFALKNEGGQTRQIWAVQARLLGVAPGILNNQLEQQRSERVSGDDSNLTAPSYVVVAEPQVLNRRMQAQQALFASCLDVEQPFFNELCRTLSVTTEQADALLRTPFRSDELLTATGIVRVDMPPGIRPEALNDFKRMGITEATLFPDLDGLARSLSYVELPPIEPDVIVVHARVSLSGSGGLKVVDLPP
jgi:FRG domain